jgi:hypothetical protein
MAAHDSAASPSFKERAKEEFIDFYQIAIYLAVLFCAFVTYTRLVLRHHDIMDETVNYTFAVINALVIGKVILIGEMMHLGRRAQARPLYQAVAIRAGLYSLLVLAFHLLEEFVKRLIHHEAPGTVLREIQIYQLLARSIIIYCVFLPLFAFRELKRILGPEKMHELFFAPRTPPSTAQPANS